MKFDEIYKIRDSIDLYLYDDKYLVVYYINTRIRKKYNTSPLLIELLEHIDGENTLEYIFNVLSSKEPKLQQEDFIQTVERLYSAGIIQELLNPTSYEMSIIERYSRQLNYFDNFNTNPDYPISAQQKLQSSHIAIVGCGAVGGNIAIQLAMSGVEKFTLIDYDLVEASDVARHAYYDESFIGKLKTRALKEYLLKINNSIKIIEFNCEIIPDIDLSIMFNDVSFVVNTADDPYIGYTSMIIAQHCMKHKIPHYIAGGFDAHLASTGELIIPYVTPCVECYASYFKEKLRNWKPNPHPVKLRYREIGGLPSMSLFSSSFATIEIIKYITSMVGDADNYKTRAEFLFDTMELNYINVERDKNCIMCGGNHD